LPDGIECRLTFRTAAVTADQLAESFLCNTDSSKASGNSVTEAGLYILRAGKIVSANRQDVFGGTTNNTSARNALSHLAAALHIKNKLATH